uniref:Uncharacterized protein n=1 Tax=Anguilla anguilla TaxID=7936 RepID=A0A0E9XZE7_ANGAN
MEENSLQEQGDPSHCESDRTTRLPLTPFGATFLNCY